jgi:hypothetical protein
MDRLSLLRVAALTGVEVYATSRLADLPATIFPSPAQAVFSSRPWYETVITDALPAAATPCFVVARESEARAVFALRREHAAVASLTTPYTCLYAPIFAPDLSAAARLAAATGFARFCRREAVIRLDALASEAPETESLIAGARAAGFIVRPFRHFGNWHEPLAGRDFAAYLADRPGPLRETIRRKRRRAGGRTTLTIYRNEDGIADGIAAFEHVYARSWKEPEPYPAFNPALMRALAPFGVVRLFILSDQSGPIAAQFWIVGGGVASVLKLAHDEAARALSPGTVLTAESISTLIAEDRISALDFGRGDDPYKALWTGARRQRIGLLLINPRRPAGLAALGREIAGALTKPLRAQRRPHFGRHSTP